jgi:vacuolar protein sorting-associated protein 13A/C
LGTGVKDFFYKPISGIIRGPIEGGKGLVLGTTSLFVNTVEGTFGSVSKVLSTMSRGLLFLADDEEFMIRREEDNLERPQNIIEGLGFGLRSTITGIAGGITGVFEKPY